MDATLWQHLVRKPGPYSVAPLAAYHWHLVEFRTGLSLTVRGILDPLIELYRPVLPLAYLPLMVIWFGIGETSKILADLSGDFRPGRYVGAGGGEERPAGSDPRGAVAGSQPHAGAVVRDFTRRAAGDFNRTAHGLGVGWSTLVAAELIAATRGLRFMVVCRRVSGVTDVVLAGIAVIAAIAFD
jgi:taurine transport system permease protein